MKFRNMIFPALTTAAVLALASPALAAEPVRVRFQNTNGAVYWMENDAVVTGWRERDGKWYYFDTETGAMQTGFFRDDTGALYYSSDSGELITDGWNQIGDDWYYMDENGVVAADTWVGPYWFREDGTWDPEQVGDPIMQALCDAGLSWRRDGWACKNEDGSLVIGDWRTLGGNRYYFGGDSYAVAGWQYIGEYKYYFDEETYALVQDLEELLGPQPSYYITVDRVRCQVMVYAPDGDNGYIIPYRTFICSTGREDSPTPTGTYKTTNKYRWHMLVGPSYGQYCTRIGGMRILFHTVPGDTMSVYNISPEKFNLLGEAASDGCVRLTVADAKWIYDNCELGTTVTIGDSLAAPFDRPEGIKIPEDQNWDPTDPAVYDSEA